MSHAPCDALLLVACVLGFVRIEPGWTLWDATYHCLVTATTVGYGDVSITTQVSASHSCFPSAGAIFRAATSIALAEQAMSDLLPACLGAILGGEAVGHAAHCSLRCSPRRSHRQC